MHVELFAGQSNALGFGNTGPAPYTPTYRVQIWVDTDGDGLGDAFNFMNPGVNTGTPSNTTAWGPEVAFAKAWLAAHAGDNEILYIGKVVKGSTSLAQSDGLDWSPASRGELFDKAATESARMRANLGIDRLEAVFWMQGEQDTTSASAAASYADHLRDFLGAVRTQWMGDPNGYIGVGRITDSAALPYSQQVRVAQWQVDQEDPHMESFKTIGFAMQPDGLHYAADGQLALGQAFFDNWAF